MSATVLFLAALTAGQSGPTGAAGPTGLTAPTGRVAKPLAFLVMGRSTPPEATWAAAPSSVRGIVERHELARRELRELGVKRQAALREALQGVQRGKEVLTLEEQDRRERAAHDWVEARFAPEVHGAELRLDAARREGLAALAGAPREDLTSLCRGYLLLAEALALHDQARATYEEAQATACEAEPPAPECGTAPEPPAPEYGPALAALTLAPESQLGGEPRAWLEYLAGWAHEERAEPGEAARRYAAALGTAPGGLAPELHFRLGQLAFDRHDDPAAATHFEAVGPGSLAPMAAYMLLWSRYRAGDCPGVFRAADRYRAALEADPEGGQELAPEVAQYEALCASGAPR